MINYKEFRELYQRLPKERICQKETWDKVQEIWNKDESLQTTGVLILRSTTSGNMRVVWFTTEGPWAYSFNIHEEEEYKKGEATDRDALALGEEYQYSLSKLSLWQSLAPAQIELLFEKYRQGKLSEKITEETLDRLFSNKVSPDSTSDLKERILSLFSAKLFEALAYEHEPQSLFQKAKENMMGQMGNEEGQRLFLASVMLWQKLFSAFCVPASLSTHVQFFTTHILSAFADVPWPGEK